MKNLKLGIWVLALAVAEASLLGYISIAGAVPALLLAFCVCTALLEDEFFFAALWFMIGAAAAASICGRSFALVFILYSICGLTVHSVRKKPRYAKGIVKAVFHTVVCGAAADILTYAVTYMRFDAAQILADIIPSAVYNAAAAAVLYFLIGTSVYGKENSRKLVQ